MRTIGAWLAKISLSLFRGGGKMDTEYKFVSEEPEPAICPVTADVMLEPHQTACCGKHLSASVVKQLVENSRPCPLCNAPHPDNKSPGKDQPVFQTHLDLHIQRKILESQVYCFYRKQGCEWKGTLRKVKEHASNCQQRPWTCQFCKFESTHHYGTTEHAQSCPQRPVECEACEESSIPYCKYSHHVKTCPGQLIPCDFAGVGCKVTFRRSDYTLHMNGNFSSHQLLVAKTNLELTRDIHSKLEQKAVPGLQQENERKLKQLQTDLKEKEEQIIEKENRIKHLEEQLQQQISPEEEEEDKEISLQLRRLQEQLEERDKELQRLQQGGEGDSADSDSRISSLQLQRITEDLKSKRSLNHREIQTLIEDLESISLKTGPTEADSCEGLVIGPGVLINRENIFEGKFERVLVSGLYQAWCIATGGNILFVTDQDGVHAVHTEGPANPSMKVIESASFTDRRVPKDKCWYPRGVALDKDLNVFLVDTGSHRVLKFSLRWKPVAECGTESTIGCTSGTFNKPIGITVSNSSNKVYVCDTNNHRVQVFDTDLRYLEEFGNKGSGVKEFLNPWDVALDAKGNIYIADTGNRCIKVFTPEYTYLKVIGRAGESYKHGDLRAPTSLCFDSHDNLYVTDKGLKRVLVYNSQGDYKCSFGKFVEPRGIAVDKYGYVYVCDNGNTSWVSGGSGRVQVYK